MTGAQHLCNVTVAVDLGESHVKQQLAYNVLLEYLTDEQVDRRTLEPVIQQTVKQKHSAVFCTARIVPN
jgi:hypothetical protein